MPIIETIGLTKQFRVRGRLVEAVRGLDVQVEAGESFGFLGPNGAGKTTSMRMLTTLIRPSGGQATIAGHDLLRAPEQVRQHIGYVSQAGGAQASCSGRENTELQGRLCGLSRAQARARAAITLATFGLTHVADRVVGGYSGGQRRRLDLALGMVQQPRLLFLDEPTVGLDPQSRAELWDELRRLKQAGTTIFMTTHYLDEADALCDRLAIVDAGRIVAIGTPEELKRQVRTDTVLLGLDQHPETQRRATSLLEVQPFVQALQASEHGLRITVENGDGFLPHILRTLDDAGVSIRSIALNRPTLDDVFAQKTGRFLHELSSSRA